MTPEQILNNPISADGRTIYDVSEARKGRVRIAQQFNQAVHELRTIARWTEYVGASAFDDLTFDEIRLVYQMAVASGWDFLPDEWTGDQFRQALRGIVPQWDAQERPVYWKEKAGY